MRDDRGRNELGAGTLTMHDDDEDDIPHYADESGSQEVNAQYGEGDKLLAPSEVLALRPRPIYIQYQ